MSKSCAAVALVMLVTLPNLAQAEINLGISLVQDNEEHPIISGITPTVRGRQTFGAYLQLEPGDEIITAHSDPITLADGTIHRKWDIRSIRDLRWVLARTTSRIGLTVKRGDEYIRAIAVYIVPQETEMTPRGPRIVKRHDLGRWTLDGPETVDEP